MIRVRRPFLAVLVGLTFCWSLAAAEPDLADYRTVETAQTTRIAKAAATVAPRLSFLGVNVIADGKSNLTIAEVAADSPAAKAGVVRGDLLLRMDGQEMKDEDAFRELLKSKAPGTVVKLSLSRRDKPMEVAATLTPLSQPMPSARQRAGLGVQLAAAKDGPGVVIEQVNPGSAAADARLKVGETILKIDDVAVASSEAVREILAKKKPDDPVTLTLLLAEKAVDLKMRLGAETAGSERSRGFESRSGYWSKPVYRIGIICVEYPDVKHSPKIPAKAWEESMLSNGTYKTSPTGQTAYGSLYDYYFEQSYGQLKVEGKAFDYVEVSKKRGEYATGNRSALLVEAMDKLLAREGKDALKNFDGVFFVYAGERYPAARGSLYWPHRASVTHNDKRWPYFITYECMRGSRMANISVFCHEFGHLLSLPDLYARPESPGMEGVGVWCAMANEVDNGRPQHFCAWSKEKLGWIKPAVIDPTVKQKLILAPVEDSPKECFKVLLRPDGSEYLLLENRQKKGFDKSLPAGGLLIWRVVGNRPVLEESHGVAGPNGPRVYLDSVPYPSASNDSFTPFTTPSSRSQLGGGLPVYITNIHRLDDGRVTFHIGYEYQ